MHERKRNGCAIWFDVRAPALAGTSDRVLLLSGSLHSVLTAIFLILEKISRDGANAAANGHKRPGGGGGRRSEDQVRWLVGAHGVVLAVKVRQEGCMPRLPLHPQPPGCETETAGAMRSALCVCWPFGYHRARRRSSWRCRGACAAC